LSTRLTTTAQRLLRTDVFTTLTGSGLSAATRLVTFALLARWLPGAAFGEWVLFQTYYTLFDTMRTGFQSAFVNHAAGTDEGTFRRWAGAAWQLSLLLTAGAILLLAGLSLGATALGFGGVRSGLVGWFAVLSVVALPNSLSDWIQYARGHFRRLQALKLTVQALFLGLAVGAWALGQLTVGFLYGGFVLANGLVGAFSLLARWCEPGMFAVGTAAERGALWRFGRFSTSTLMAANLLRSSDTMLIGALLGPAAVVVYSVPQRVVELLEMPIRSTVITSVPRLAALFGQPAAMADFFQKMAGRLWMVLLPASVGCFVLAEPLVVWLGGATYRESAGLLRIFMVYTAFLPLDRYAGIGLDAVRRPLLNLTKVAVMLLVNVTGDLLALYGFHSVTGVALASIGTFLTGLGLGYFWLGKAIPVSLGGTVRTGFRELLHWLRQRSYAGVR
jgi:O-antigen/teichoic acid export membrane protein